MGTAQQTQCGRGLHPLAGANLTITSQGRRLCRTCDRARRAGYRAQDPEAFRAYGREYRALNPEAVKAAQDAWRERNPDYNREWRERNAEHLREYRREYRARRRAELVRAGGRDV